jgi:hypothetical protein
MSTTQVTFIEYRLPGLQSGTYTVKVEQQVDVAGPESFSATRNFQVRGERFSITDDEIHAVFPPEKATGPYNGSLPHVVFDRAMLPWLRGVATDAPDGATWLAVLTFDHDEMPALLKRKVRELVMYGVNIRVPAPGGPSDDGVGSLPSDTLSYPFDPPWNSEKCLLEYGESPDNTVLSIDVPVAMFKTVAPSLTDLGFLAHVREVDVTGRSAAAGTGGAGSDGNPDVGQFSAVLGNRTLAPGPGNAVLVSLEGLGDHLPGGQNFSALDKYNSVRLAVLKAWTFDTLPDPESVLRHALDNLCDTLSGDANLRIPAAIPTADEVEDALTAQATGSPSPDQANVLVRHALALGFVPFGHRMRTGGSDVSWYRGPITSVPVTAPLTMPIASSDAALAYNPETGMFDVSYAVAWQLGQMLGLSDASFSAAIYGWQRAMVEQTAAAQDSVSGAISHLQHLAVRSPLTQDAVVASDPASLFARIVDSRLARYVRYRTRATDGPPDEVTDWLDQLKNLKNLPMRYLIPDAHMLPPESMRFFYLDINWVNALLDGACSIARWVSGNSVTQTPWLYSADSAGKTSGFLLNSSVVLGWPGLRISAFANNKELDRIYDDNIVPGVRMLMFDGDLDKLNIKEAAEGLHFGVDVGTMPPTVALRYLQEKVGQIITANGNSRSQSYTRATHYDRVDGRWQRRDKIDDDVAPSVTVVVATRSTDNRVLDITATAGAIRNALADHGEDIEEADFTSAQFALEMVMPIANVTYQLDKTNI